MGKSGMAARAERLSFLLPQIVHRLQRVPIRSQVAPAVSLPQLRMLMILDVDGPSTMGDLAHRASVTMPTATSSINALVGGRYVSRRRAEHDRRVVIVSLTARGRRTLEDLNAVRCAQLGTVLEHIDDAEQQRFIDAFETIHELIKKMDDAVNGGET
jgi:DNA-binding MarR family transcriptional regulator